MFLRTFRIVDISLACRIVDCLGGQEFLVYLVYKIPNLKEHTSAFV